MYKKHCCILPGTYCEVHDEPTPTNTMAWQTHERIALGPTGNQQGSVKFYCLTTGRVLKHCSFTQMPMPDWVIKRVNAIGECEGQGRTFWFLNRQKEPYKWTNEIPEDDTDFQGLLKDERKPYTPMSVLSFQEWSSKLGREILPQCLMSRRQISGSWQRQHSTTLESTQRSNCGLPERQRVMHLWICTSQLSLKPMRTRLCTR
jgi:hypothetical protein